MYKSVDLNICQFSSVFILFVYNTNQANACAGVLLGPSSRQVAFGQVTVSTSALTGEGGGWRYGAGGWGGLRGMGGEKEYKKGDRASKRHHKNTNVGYLPSSTFLQRIDLLGVIYNILYCQ